MGSKTTTTQSMPEFQQEFLEETVLPYAKGIAEREFTPYEGERVAGMTPLQQQALAGYGGLNLGGAEYGLASQTYGDLAGFKTPEAQAAELAAARELSGAGQLASTDIQQYMSPYTEGVIESSLRQLGGAQEMALNQQAAAAQRAKAFGGSRQGVAEAETRKAYGQQASDLITRQMQQAFQQAQGAAQFDIGQRMRADLANQQAVNEFARQQAQLQQQANLANQQAALQAAGVRATGAAGLGSIAGQRLQSQLAGLGAQMQAGEAARGLDQARLDAAYAEFARQQDFPLTGLNALATAASGIPSGYGTTTQSYGGLGPALGAVGSLGMGLGPRGFGFFGT